MKKSPVPKETYLLIQKCGTGMGSEEPASGNVEALQHKDSQGRKYPCLPDFQLDGERHLAVH